MSLTKQLAELVANKPIAARDLEVSALFLLDATANMIAGQNSSQGKKLLAWAREIAPEGHLSALDDGRKAFLLGALCHILEVDDLHRASIVHPGCIVGPVALVLGAKQNGQGVLTAFLKGVEATTRVGMSVGSKHYKIWHNTATCGPFGSAVCAASLYQLSIDQTVHALGNAGSQACGFWEFLTTGAETKHMHAGRGAESGLVAAQLAKHGFTGAPEILEGPRGFYAGTCPNPEIDQLLAKPNDVWQMHLTSIKPWPSCRHTHPAIEIALSLAPTNNADPNNADPKNADQWQLEDVESIRGFTYQATIDLCDQPLPNSVYAAKFSLQHCIAAALSDGQVGLDSFDEKARKRLKTVREKVSISIDEKVQAAYPKQWGARIELDLADGTVIHKATSSAYGDPDAPLDRTAMIKKANMLFEHAGFQNSDGLIKNILAMPNGAPCPDIIALLDANL